MAERRAPQHAAPARTRAGRWGLWAAIALAVVITVVAVTQRRDGAGDVAASPRGVVPAPSSETAPASPEPAPSAPTPDLPAPSELPQPVAQVVPAGDPAVYARIGTLTDCAALQAEWQQAVALGERTRHGTQPHQEALGYVAAAEARMADCGCM